MISEDILIQAGYKRYKDTTNHSDWLYQKAITWSEDSSKKLYFINIYYYKFPDREGWELDMSFDRDSTVFPYCWIKYKIDPSVGVEYIERVAKDIFDSNNGIPHGD